MTKEFDHISACPPMADNSSSSAPPTKKAKTESSSIAGEGASVPSVTFKCRVRVPDSSDANPFDWKDVGSDDLFKGKRVGLFALPGAFTPTVRVCDHLRPP